MKIKTEVEVILSAKAVYRDDQIRLSVDAAIPYAKRQAAASVEGASDKVLKMFDGAFKALLEEKQNEAVKTAQAAHAESVTVAARMGEL